MSSYLEDFELPVVSDLYFGYQKIFPLKEGTVVRIDAKCPTMHFFLLCIMNNKNIKNMFICIYEVTKFYTIVALYVEIFEVVNVLFLKRPPACSLVSCSHELC